MEEVDDGSEEAAEVEARVWESGLGAILMDPSNLLMV